MQNKKETILRQLNVKSQKIEIGSFYMPTADVYIICIEINEIENVLGEIKGNGLKDVIENDNIVPYVRTKEGKIILIGTEKNQHRVMQVVKKMEAERS